MTRLTAISSFFWCHINFAIFDCIYVDQLFINALQISNKTSSYSKQGINEWFINIDKVNNNL